MERRPGVWRLRVFMETIDGRPVQAERTFRGNKTEALAELRRFVAEVNAGKVTKRVRGTVGSMLQEWLEYGEKVGQWAPLTLVGRKGIVDNHLLPALGDIPLAKLTASDIANYLSAVDVGPSTVRLHHQILRSSLNQAVEWEKIPSSPANRVRPPKSPKKARVIPTVEQVKLLIEAAGDDIELATAVALAALTGLRRGELCGLRWEDVDWEHQVLRVVRQRIHTRGTELTTGLKTGDHRLVGLGDFGEELLLRYSDAGLARFGQRPHGDGWLLSYDLGRTSLNPDKLGAQVSALGKRTGITVTTHAFRRFAATQMIGAGVDVVTAAERLGHSPAVMFGAYAGLVAGKDAAAATAMGLLLREETPEP